MIYLVIFLLLIWLTYLYDYRRDTRGYNIGFFLILIIFISVAGFRYKVGGDTTIYMKFFENIHPLNAIKSADFTKSRFAPGFVFLTSFIRTFTDDFTWFQLFHAIVVNCVVFAFIRRNCRHVFFALLLFFNYLYFYLLFEQMRESFAVAIFLLAWPAFKKGIWWKWYIASVCAFLMHVSAFIMFFLPLICLPGIRNIFIFGKRTWYLCLGAFIVAFVLQSTLFRYIEMISVTEAMIDRAQAYASMDRSEILNINRIFGNIIQFIAYPLLALYFLSKQKNIGVNSATDSFVKEKMMVLMSVYISIFSIFIGILVRYNNYFFLFAIVLMGDWAFTNLHILRKYVRLGYLYWILLFIPMFSFNFYNTYLTPVNKTGTLKAYMMYYPYSSVIDQTEDQNREKTVLYIRRRMR